MSLQIFVIDRPKPQPRVEIVDDLADYTTVIYHHAIPDLKLTYAIRDHKVTTCTILSKGRAVGSGWAVRNEKDKFDALLGLEWAFCRAIASAGANFNRRCPDRVAEALHESVYAVAEAVSQ